MRAALATTALLLLVCALTVSSRSVHQGYYEPLCTCVAVLCWYTPVEAPDEWWPAGWLWQIERWRIAAFWNLETDWRCPYE